MLAVGLKHTATLPMSEQLLVPHLPSDFTGFTDMPPVLATGYMVVFMEWACVQALKPYMQEGQRTVGTDIDVSHCAATPIGHTLRANVELVAMDGRKLLFEVECFDDHELIGEGMHERCIVDVEKFLSKVQKKRG